MILVDAQLVSPFLFIVGSLLSLVIVVFSVGAYGLEHHVFVASDTDTDSDSFPCVSLYFNLYVVIVASYITIRVYTLFVDPMFQSLSSKLYYGGGATGTPSSVRSATDVQTKKNTNTYTSSDDGTITTAKEQQRKGNSTNTATTHHQHEQDQEQVQNQQDGNNEKTTMVLNMTGNYQLVSHENFEEFLGTQGVPKMFQGLACKSRPIHRIVHTKRNHRTPTTTTTIETNPQQYDTVSIKAEGIVDTYVEYNLDGPAIVTKIKGKPYEDTMTYLTYEEMGIPPPGLPPTTTTSPTDTNGVEATRNSADTGDEDDDYSSTDSISADASASASASSEDGGSEEEEAETVVSSATLNMSGEFIDQESSTSFDILKQKMLAQFTEGGNLRTSKVKRLIRRSSKKAKKGKKNQNCSAAPSTLPPSKKKETPGLTTTTTTAAENDEHTVVNSDVTEDDGTTMTTKNTNNNNNTQIYCGVKNIKRQHEEKYTLIVQRYVHTNQTKIDMILHVKYDDPNKKNVIAKQYYERI